MRLVHSDDLLSVLPMCAQPPLQPGHHPSLSQPQPDTLYVRPMLRRAEALAGPISGSVVLVSSPGAVGKSAMATHIAAGRATVLWDLSKIQLGDNSFAGTLVNAFGPSEFAQVLLDCQRGKSLLVIDAFDEAELRSGWKQVQQFVGDLWSAVHQSPEVSAVLLARSETALRLDGLLSQLSAGQRRHEVVEIDYFDRAGAAHFIEIQLEHRWESTAFRKHPDAFRAAFQALIDSVAQSLGGTNEDVWQSSVGRTFFGYAPVLQAVASVLASMPNFFEAEQRFRSYHSHSDAVALLSQLMTDLLVREHEKVITPLREQFPKSAIDWALLYSPAEQLHRIVSQCVGDPDALLPGTNLPPEVQESYANALSVFLPNHAFLRGADFAGPAFRDYSLAGTLAAGDDWAEVILEDSPSIPSPLFAGFYARSCGGSGDGRHAGYLYESAVARYGLQAGALSTVVAPGDDVGLHELAIDPDDATGVGSEPFRMLLAVSSERPLIFGHRLRNAYVVTPSAVVLGRAASVLELANVEVCAGMLDIRAKRVAIRRFAEGQVVVLQADKVSDRVPLVRVDTPDSDALAVHWPGAERYPWAPYNRDTTFAEQLDPQGAMLALRRVLTWFRRDKKEEFKRYRDLIDNVAVAHNRTRQAMLNFLLTREVVRLEGRMYTFNDEVARTLGINWTALGTTRPSGALLRFVEDFLRFSVVP